MQQHHQAPRDLQTGEEGVKYRQPGSGTGGCEQPVSQPNTTLQRIGAASRSLPAVSCRPSSIQRHLTTGRAAFQSTVPSPPSNTPTRPPAGPHNGVHAWGRACIATQDYHESTSITPLRSSPYHRSTSLSMTPFPGFGVNEGSKGCRVRFGPLTTDPRHFSTTNTREDG